MATTSLRTWVTGEFELSDSQRNAVALLREHLRARSRLVLLQGPNASGKTVIAGYFAQFNRDFFSGGAAAVEGVGDVVAVAQRALSRNGPSLLVVEEPFARVADDWREEAAARIREVWSALPDCRIILTSSLEVPDIDVDARIVLARPTEPQVRSQSGLVLDAPESERLQTWLRDRVLTPRTVVEARREGILASRNIAADVELYDQAVLLGADGRPLPDEATQGVALHVRAASERLFEVISDSPDLLQALEPREFEEVVAEYFHRQGFEVELTAASRDGGKDIYVARTEALGRFLYIVECKAFSPTNPVGVRYVRHLYGVVQHERATAGVLATTSHFTRDAHAYQQDVQFQLSLQDFDRVRAWFTPQRAR